MSRIMLSTDNITVELLILFQKTSKSVITNYIGTKGKDTFFEVKLLPQ